MQMKFYSPLTADFFPNEPDYEDEFYDEYEGCPLDGHDLLQYADAVDEAVKKDIADGLLFCPIRDKMDPDHIEIAILQDDASKANRIIEKLQLDVVDTGTAELVDAVQQNLENAAPNHEDTPAVDFPLGSENASPSEPFSDSSKSFANSPSPCADQLRAKGERPSVRMELQDITAYLRNRAEAPKDRMPKLPVKIRRKEKVL